MRLVTLIRHETSEQGTFGRIDLPEGSFFTGELPWRDNRNDFSCIPTGSYISRVTFSPAFHRGLYLVAPVETRSGIRIHPANFMGDKLFGFHCQLNGCIALGEKIGWMDGQKSVLLSAPAVRKFQSIMKNQPFKLEVKNA